MVMKLLTEADVRKLLEKECEKAGSAANWSQLTGVPASNISNVLTGKRGIGNQIPKALGLKRVWVLDEEITQ